MEITRYEPGAPDTPRVLRRCAEAKSILGVALKGDLGILNKMLIGFFCSVRCPGDVILKTYDLARGLREMDATIVGGFQSPMEKECLDLLLRGSVSVVICPARGLGGMRIPKDWKGPLAEGRMLILSFFDDQIRRPTSGLAVKRNDCIAALADRILIAHAEKGGKTEELCKDILAKGKPVFTLDSPDNAHLVEQGAVPISAFNSASLCSSWQT